MSGELPKRWVDVLLPDVAAKGKFAIVDGPFGSDLKLSDYVPNGPVPVLTTKNLTGTYDPSSVRFISYEKFEQLKRSKVVSGDILIAKIGSIGKCSIYPDNAPTAIIPANLCKISVNGDISFNRFIYWQIKSAEFQEKLKDITSATAQPAFSVQRLKTLSIKIAPLPEQRRIVAKLENLLGKVNACQKRLERIPLILKRFRQSVLAAACSGRLTEDWREENQKVESAFELLKNVNNDAEVCEDTDLPPTWSKCYLESLADLITKGASPRWQGINYSDDGVLFVTSENVGWGKMLLEQSKYVEPKINEIQPRSILKQGDILTNIVGASIGRSAIYESDAIANVNQAVALIRLRKGLERRYILHVLNSPSVVDYIHNQAVDVARANVSLSDVRRFPIAVPPLAEQKEIVRRVKTLYALADTIETRHHKAKAHVDKLTQSILAKAFRGELVPQDSNDEPAEVLLERIRKERDQTESNNAEPKRGSKRRKPNVTE
jgi:type I restriction enzyme, S subunit